LGSEYRDTLMFENFEKTKEQLAELAEIIASRNAARER
jgi:hypothetical protein